MRSGKGLSGRRRQPGTHRQFQPGIPDESGPWKNLHSPTPALCRHKYFEVFQGYRCIMGYPEALDVPGKVVITQAGRRLFSVDTDRQR